MRTGTAITTTKGTDTATTDMMEDTVDAATTMSPDTAADAATAVKRIDGGFVYGISV